MSNTLDDTNPEAQALASEIINTFMSKPADKQASMDAETTKPQAPSLQTEEEVKFLADQVLCCVKTK